MPGLLPNIDPDGLLEYSVVYTDRSLNHMSQSFQGVMKGISSTLKDVYQAPALSKALYPYLNNQFNISNWTQRYGAFFKAVKMEKTMIYNYPFLPEVIARKTILIRPPGNRNDS